MKWKKSRKTILDSLPKSSYKSRWGTGDVRPRASVFDNKKAKKLKDAHARDSKEW